MPLRLRLSPYSTLYLCVLAVAVAVVTSWATFTAYTAKLDKHSHALASADAKQTPRGNAKARYGDLPLSFELNRGQADGEVKFLARGVGYNIFLTPTEAALVLSGSSAATETSAVNETEIDSDGPAFRRRQIETSHNAKATPPVILRMKLDGATSGRVEGVQELPGKVNYFIGEDASKWLTDVPTFRKVAYRNVYEGVDAIYYGNRQQLEYDLVVAPGTDPSVIKIKYEGTESLRVDRKGTLLLKTPAGEIQQPKPLIYQQENGQRKLIEGRYVIRGSKRVGFSLDKYDRRKPLIIDPKLVYLSLINGGGYGYAIAVDTNGSAYIAGEILDPSSLNPTAGAFQATLLGTDNAFVTKLDASGTNVVYSTYLGTANGAYADGIAVDGQGNAYVTGGAGAGFPTTAGSYQTTNRGRYDSFITKLNASGSALVYSTFYGGNNYDEGDGIAVDAAGSAYVGGIAGSTDLITTAGAPQTSSGGGYDGFAIKLNPSGSAVTYATYFGGGGSDTVNGTIAVDSSGNAYVTAQTGSLNLPQINAVMGPAGLDRGVFKSTNSGSSWSLSRNGLQTSTVSALAVDRNAANTLYAATGGGVYKSTDAGLNWSNTGAIYPNGLALAMADSSTIYVGTDGGVNKTTNAGTSWSVSYTGNSIRALAIDPTNAAIVYAGGTDGVLKSTNSGGSWTVMNSGMNRAPVRSIVIDPTNTSIVYLAAGNNANSRVFKSTNGGASWSLVSTGLPASTIFSLALDPNSPLTLYAGTNSGMYKTTNGGTGWSVINTGLTIQYTDNVNRTPGIAAVAVSTPSTTLYATSSSTPTSAGAFPLPAVFKSTDGGATWAANATGLVGGNLVSLAVDPTDATKIYVGNAGDVDGYLVKINPTGTGFVNATYVGSSGFDSATGVAVDSSNSPYIVGYTQGNNFQTSAGAFQTSRQGIADAYVMKLTPAGNQISYSTLLGGLDSEFTLGGIAVNPSGNAFVLGFTASSDFPTTAGSFQRTFGSRGTGGNRDSFVTELNSTGTGLVYSSYLGGAGDEPGPVPFFGSRLALDPAGNTYVVGTTGDPNSFPAFDSLNGFNANGTYVAKIDPNTPTFSINGRLTTSLNVGIAGVYVEAEGPAGVSHNGITDGQGYYSIINLPAGDYIVTPSKYAQSGTHYVFTPATRTFTSLNSDQTADFTGNQVFDISGQITSSVVSGQGLFDVTVTLSGSASVSVVTDVFGSFRFENLPTGNYTVTPSKPGFVFSPSSATFNSLSADQFTSFTSASGSFFTISGHVADGSNTPVSGANVYMLVRPTFGSTNLAAQTDANGNYSFSNLQAGGNYTLTPTKPLFTFSPLSPTVSNLSANQAVNFTASAVTGLTGKIAFMKFDQAGAVTTMNADGTGETNLVTVNGECSTDESGPAWSPDGSRIAFSGCNQSGTEHLYLVNSDGTNATQITDGAIGNVFPNWSPDGTRLTFTYGECSGAENQIPEVFTMDLASKVRTQLTNNSVVDATSSWSPNGSSIAFARGDSADCSGSDFLGDIYTISPQGTNETRLTNANALSYLPAYSPDGSKIAFTRETIDLTHNFFARNIYVMNADGSNQTKITPDLLDAVKPTWSPDGSKIAFSADSHAGGAYSAIFVVNPDGTGLAQVTNSTTASRELPDWQHILISPSPTPTPTPAPGAPSTSNLFGVLSGFVDVNQSGDFVFFGSAQSAIFLRRASDGTTTRLYQMSDPVPGLAGTRGELFSPSPRINNSGRVAFVTDYIANAQFQRALLLYNGSTLTPVINSTDIAPNSAGATYGRTITLGGLNNSGDLAFTATPNAVTTLYVLPNGGSSTRIAGGGDAAPGTGGTFSNIALANGANSLSDNSGEVVFTAQIVGGSGGFGVFVASTTGVRKVVANGDAIPGGGTFSINSAPVARLNRFGQVAFVANNATSNSTIWMHTPATGIVKAVSNGDAAPGALGGTLSAPTLAAFNDNPYVVFTANVTGSGVTPRGVFRVNPGGAVETVAFANQAAPGASPATFSTFSGVSMDNVAGIISFQSTLAGGSIGHGLFRQSGVNSPVSIVLDGQSAAVPGGGTFNLTNTTRSKTLDNGMVYSFANVFGGPTTYAEFLADNSSTTILMNDGTAMPAGTRTSMRSFRAGAAGDYISFLGQSTGGRRSYIIRNLVTGNYSTLVTEGDSAPGGGRLRFTNLNVTYVNASGTIVFAAQIIGGPLGVTTGIFSVSSSGTITKVVADGDLEPNTNSAFSSPTLNSFAPSPLNSAGQIVFRATVLSKLGIYVYTPGNPIQRIAQNGDSAPGGGTFVTPSSAQAINLLGQVAFFSTTSGGPGTNQGIFIGAAGSALAKVAVSGDPVPGSTTFATFPNVGYSFNDSGEVAFKAALNGGALAGVFVGSTTRIQTIAVNGNFSNAGAVFNTAVNADVQINNEDDVVFHSGLTGGGTDSAYFLRRGPSGSLQVVATQGQAAPGTNGTFATFFPTANSFVGENFALGPTGEVGFTNTVQTSGGNAFGAFRFRTDNLLEKILARGDIVPGTNGGIFSTIFQGMAAGGPGHFAFWVPVLGGSVDDLIYVTNSPAVDVSPASALKITGRVVDTLGNPLSGITVNLTGTASGSTQTDASGNYAFANLASGNYTVSPLTAGYAFSPSSYAFNLTFDHICVFVATQTAVSISGKVTDSNNAGINGVTVALIKNGVAAGTTQTNAQGDYTFTSLNPGDTYVVTPTGSFSPSSQTFSNLTTNATANFKSTPNIPPQCSVAAFGSANSLNVGSNPFAVVAGDFNNDGKSDLATANNGSNNVSVLLGSGTGTFAPANTFPAGTSPSGIVTRDFNRDGALDLAVANNGSNNVSVLLGTGSGSFGAATNFAAGSFPGFIVTADLNGDGNSDLAVANRGSHTISILISSGSGTFNAVADVPTDAIPQAVAVGDLNNDGRIDLLVANSGFGPTEISVFLGTGNGAFGPAINLALTTAPLGLATGDFNGDGKLDLVVTNSSSNTVSVRMGNGSGGFGAASDFAVGTGPNAVLAVDLNGDTKLDLAVSNNSSNTISVLLGDSAGGFSAATNISTAGSNPGSIAVSDFNADGKVDVALANCACRPSPGTSNLAVILNVGNVCNTQGSLSISGRVADPMNHSLPEITVTLSGPVSRVTQTDPSGNYSFPNLTPGGNYTVTVQTPYYIVLPARADFFNLTSNQTANFVAAPLAVPAPSPPPSDNFNNAARDATKWSVGTQTEPANAFDPQVTSAQVNGQLVITPLTQAVGMHYAGYVSANSFDMRNSKVSVELVQAATGGADSIFSIGSDANDFFRFLVHTSGVPTSLAPKAKGPDGIVRELDSTVPQLVFQVNVNGVITSQSINYSPVQHRFLRFRNELPGPTQPFGAIVFETSPASDFSPVSFQYSVALSKAVNPMTAELSAGTSNPTNPGPTIFDNYGLVTSTFQFNADRYSVTEGAGSVLITVTRAGSIADAATVHFETGDDTAIQVKNYLSAIGTLSFAPQETTKTFTVPIVDNALPEGNLTLNLFLGNPVGSGLNAPGRAVITIIDNDTTDPGSIPTLLQLLLEQSGPSPNQLAAVDAALFTRDPFAVVNAADVLNMGPDRNTRVSLFATNLQLAQGETASAVVVNLVDAGNHSYQVTAEDVRPMTSPPFTQVIFRLPDNLSAGTCTVSIKAHGQTSNVGTIRIRL